MDTDLVGSLPGDALSMRRPEHGGRLIAAARRYGRPVAEWIDCSTGIHPQPYPLPAPPAEVWQRLPEPDDGLEAVAADYYGTPELLAVPGSQAAIEWLATLRMRSHGRSRVAVLSPGYAEHPVAWSRGGHEVRAVPFAQLDDAASTSDVVVLVNPNNPTGAVHTRDALLAAHARLARRGGWLVVDEAFVDTGPGASLAPAAGAQGLLVLRSLGKFFGLGGVRLGFLCAAADLRAAMADAIGPWAVSHPARWAGRLALADREWQAGARDWLEAAATRLDGTLARCGLPLAPCATPLFRWVPTPHAAALHEALARQGILTRAVASLGLRVGLPPRCQEAELAHRLDAALAEFSLPPETP